MSIVIFRRTDSYLARWCDRCFLKAVSRGVFRYIFILNINAGTKFSEHILGKTRSPHLITVYISLPFSDYSPKSFASHPSFQDGLASSSSAASTVSSVLAAAAAVLLITTSLPGLIPGDYANCHRFARRPSAVVPNLFGRGRSGDRV